MKWEAEDEAIEAIERATDALVRELEKVNATGDPFQRFSIELSFFEGTWVAKLLNDWLLEERMGRLEGS